MSVECCDMSNETAGEFLLRMVREKHRRINTIMHASGVLLDGRLHDMYSVSVSKSWKMRYGTLWCTCLYLKVSAMLAVLAP